MTPMEIIQRPPTGGRNVPGEQVAVDSAAGRRWRDRLREPKPAALGFRSSIASLVYATTRSCGSGGERQERSCSVMFLWRVVRVADRADVGLQGV